MLRFHINIEGKSGSRVYLKLLELREVGFPLLNCLQDGRQSLQRRNKDRFLSFVFVESLLCEHILVCIWYLL